MQASQDIARSFPTGSPIRSKAPVLLSRSDIDRVRPCSHLKATQWSTGTVIRLGQHIAVRHLVESEAERDPDVVICSVAEDIPVDLIVMGSRGRRGLRHVLIGSIAERTIRLAPCPVLVTKAPIADREFDSHSIEEIPKRR